MTAALVVTSGLIGGYILGRFGILLFIHLTD